MTREADEERNADGIVQQLRTAGGSKGSRLHIDHELGKRKADQGEPNG